MVASHYTIIINKYIANILKAYVQDENVISFPTIYIRNISIGDDPMVVSFDMTSLYMKFKKYIHNDNQFSRKTHLAGTDGNKFNRCVMNS